LAGAVLKLSLITILVCGCTSSTAPTFTKREIAGAIEDICQNEYKLDVRTFVVGETLWVYYPVQDLRIKNDKKDTEKFIIEENKSELSDYKLLLRYYIKPGPDTKIYPDEIYNKKIMENMGYVWRAMYRVIFSMERSGKNDLQFLCLLVADTKKGYAIKEVVYHLDLKKVWYGFISREEYSHRAVEDIVFDEGFKDNLDGTGLYFNNVTMDKFIAAQVQNRINLKFQKPEVGKNADIDKEIIKIIASTLKTYDYTGLAGIELDNMVSKETTNLSAGEVFARAGEK
jgi:hypothetical protein